jgi:hypothetical protein
MSEISEEVQEIINYVLKENKEIEFKTCTECGRTLPCHDWFLGKHSMGKYGRESKCKECTSKLKRNGTYKFINNLKVNWYDNIEEEFKINYRIMSNEQLSKYYNVSLTNINTLVSKLKLKKLDSINCLTENEIIKM